MLGLDVVALTSWSFDGRLLNLIGANGRILIDDRCWEMTGKMKIQSDVLEMLRGNVAKFGGNWRANPTKWMVSNPKWWVKMKVQIWKPIDCFNLHYSSWNVQQKNRPT